MAIPSTLPNPSALSTLLTHHHAKTETTALPLEILHNLQHQHGWRDLTLHSISTENNTLGLTSPDMTSPQTPRSHLEECIYLISGLPPRHAYLHPDLQTTLIRRKIPEKSVVIQREWVLPKSLGEKWSLKKYAGIFDALPPREGLEVKDGVKLTWKDAKRVLMGMLSTNGMGGDGTVVYYIMQEGEVKPRQNG